jgi:hypothetical protein
MNAVEFRTWTFAEHAKLRALIEEVRTSSAREPRREAGADPGRVASVGRLASGLRDHNTREELLLKMILDKAGRRSSAEYLYELHTAEHAELQATLVDAPFNPKRLGYLLDRLLEHMAREEKSYLGEEGRS